MDNATRDTFVYFRFSRILNGANIFEVALPFILGNGSLPTKSLLGLPGADLKFSRNAGWGYRIGSRLTVLNRLAE